MFDMILGIIRIIDNLNMQQIQRVQVPCGIPLVYKFDKNMVPIPQPKGVPPLSGEFLEKRVSMSVSRLVMKYCSMLCTMFTKCIINNIL